MTNVLEIISSHGILPELFAQSAERAVAQAEALRKSGLDLVELSMQSSCALDALKAIAADCPDMLLGVGTVLTLEQAQIAVAAGAQFLSTPAVNAEVMDYCRNQGVAVLPGCTTPADVERALALGVDTVKFFPAEAAGGLPMLRCITSTYSAARFIPSGGILLENMEAYLHTPGVAAVGGSWMLGEDSEETARMTKASVFEIFQYVFEHVGINYSNVPDMEPLVFQIADMFDLVLGDTGSSTFVGHELEITKEMYRGEHGHIGFRTNDLTRSIFYFKKAGIELEEESYRAHNGEPHVIYFKEHWGDFAWHLQMKNNHNPPLWEHRDIVRARGGVSNKYDAQTKSLW